MSCVFASNSHMIFPLPLQAAEYHLVDLFEVANLCAIHAKRVTISKLSLNERFFFSFALLCLMETCPSYKSISITGFFLTLVLIFEVISSFDAL